MSLPTTKPKVRETAQPSAVKIQFYVVVFEVIISPLLPGEGALCSIPIENILAVERLEEESFRMKNVSLRKFTTRNILPPVRVYTRESRDSSLTPVLPPPPDVPGHSTGASALHPGQQLCGGPRLD